MGLSRCKSKAVVNNYFTKNNNTDDSFALLDDDVLLSCKRKLQTSGIFKMGLALLVIICLFDQALGEKELPDLSKIPTPPSFTHEPNPDTMYYVVEQQSLSNANGDGNKATNSPSPDSNGLNLKERRFRCQASGFPSVTYKWLKNGNEFKLDNNAVSDRITRIPGEGSFIFSKLHNEDKGIYECIAENGNGTAKDKPIKFIRTSIELLHIKQETLDVEFGERFEKDCIPPPSVPAAKAYWILMSGPSDQRRLFQTINFTNVAINDKGTIYFQYVRDEDNIPNYYYTCTAENVELKDYKFGYQFNFNVLKKPGGRTKLGFVAPEKQYVSPRHITVLQGQSLELFCIFSGYPDNIPSWTKSAQELNSSRISYSTNFKKSMKIDNVGVEDEGVYLCNFDDNRLNQQFEVTVDAAPYWVGGHLPSNVNSSQGSTVEFICNAHGRPTPEFKFYKNGNEIFNGGKYQIEGSRLTIRDINKADGGLGDNAVYQCNASNQYGFLWANFYLNILAFPPIVLTDDGEVETVVGKPVKLTCRVFGSPMPTVSWASPSLMGYQERRDYTIGRVEPDGSASLEIKNVKKKMEGEYKCTFKNIYDEDSSTHSIVVRNATEILLPLQNQEITIGKPLEIECNAKHDPNLKVKYVWKVNGHVLEPTDRIKIDPSKNKLIVENPTGFDSGKYECVAQTDLDNVSTSADIIVKDIPPSPTGVGVRCFADRALVSFYYEERSTVAKKADKWVIQYTIDPSEPDAWDTYVTELNQLQNGRGSAEISLFPFGQFAFRVLARNEIGSSVPAYTEEKNVENGINGRCITAAAVPAHNPDKVEIQPNVDGHLIVNWEPVPRRNWYGPKFEYVVQYKPSNDEDAAYKNKSIEDPHQKSAVIDDVESYKEYDVRVWSKNEEGVASKIPTTASGKSGETAPKLAPTGFEVLGHDGPSSAKFRWDPIDKNAIGGEFKGYKIVHWTSTAKRSEPTRKEAYFDSEATEGTVFDLKPNKENFAQIMVYSNAGDGPPTEPPLSFMMPEGVPTPVQDVSVFPISDDEIGVLWKPPREVNGNLTGYEITVCPIKDEKVVESECLPPKEIKSDDLTESRIKDLDPASPYRVELRGKTNSGLGDPVSVETNTTVFYEKDHPAAPSPPSVENVQIGHDHINVTWKPGSYDLGDPSSKPPGEGFFVKYRRDGDGDDAWIAVNESTGNGLSVTLKDLSPATKYEVRTVSIRESSTGRLETESGSHYFTTAGEPSTTATVGWLIAIIIAIIILVIILIIVCLVVRNRGAKYPVSEKEKEQGREPMLKDEKGFGEYAKPDVDEEKRSLTAESKPESETDSMAEYGDGETGRFTEDGSFIGQYGAANKTTAPERGKPNLSTFV